MPFKDQIHYLKIISISLIIKKVALRKMKEYKPIIKSMSLTLIVLKTIDS